MTRKIARSVTAVLFVVSMIGGTAVFAEAKANEDPMAEAKAFLASPTSLSQATTTAEAAAKGKVSSIKYQQGKHGAPNLIMAEVTLADGSEKIVALNPADGKVMSVKDGEQDGQDEGHDGESQNEADGEGSEGSGN